MAKTKEQKGVILRDLQAKIDKSKSIVFAKFNKLGVKDNEALRQGLKKEQGEFFVTKKTLLELALRDKQIAGLNPRDFDGKVAAIFGYNDEVAPAKVIDKFLADKDKEEKIDFLGAVLEGKFITAEEVKVLAKLPGRKELQAKLVGTLQAPISGFANALAGNLRNLVYVLKAIEEKRQ